MKYYLIIFFVLSTPLSYGQFSDISSLKFSDTNSTKYIVGDRIIACVGCKIDFCGSLINSKGDTLGIVSDLHHTNPLYITTNKIVLSSDVAVLLTKRNKVKSVNVYKCAQGRTLFKDLAKFGIIQLELRDTIIKSNPFFYFIKLANPNKDISGKNVFINGLLTDDDQLRYPSSTKMEVNYDTRKNTFDVLVK